MIRQVVFRAVFAAIASVVAVLPGDAQEPAKGGQGQTRPPAEIAMSRLKADTVLALTLEPGGVATADAVWVRSRGAGTVTRIDAKTNALGTPITVGAEPCASLVMAFESLWVPLCGDRRLARVDPTAAKVSTTSTVTVASPEGRVATSVGSIWVITDRAGVMARVDPDTNLPVAEVFVPRGAASVETGKDQLWVTSEEAGRLTRVNPHTHEVVDEIAVGPRPLRLAVGEGAVWTLNGDGTVTRVDPATNKVVATIALGGSSTSGDIAVGAGSVWISTPGAPITRIDPRTNRATQRFTGDGGGAILVAHGSVWVNAGSGSTWRLDPKLVEAVRP